MRERAKRGPQTNEPRPEVWRVASFQGGRLPPLFLKHDGAGWTKDRQEAMAFSSMREADAYIKAHPHA